MTLTEKQHEVALQALSVRGRDIGLQLVENHREHLGNRPDDVRAAVRSLQEALAAYEKSAGKPIEVRWPAPTHVRGPSA